MIRYRSAQWDSIYIRFKNREDRKKLHKASNEEWLPLGSRQLATMCRAQEGRGLKYETLTCVMVTQEIVCMIH